MSAGARLTKSVDEVVERLLGGGLAIIPTETVYGIAADATNPEAIEALMEAKGRGPDHPLPVQVFSETEARTLVSSWPAHAGILAERFWPGPLTLVVPKNESISARVSAGGPNVGIRCPDHQLTLEVLRRLGRPVAVPSANVTGQAPALDAQSAMSALPGADLLVLDGGTCPGSEPSTVVSLADDPPVLLRAGALPIERIEEVLGVRVQALA